MKDYTALENHNFKPQKLTLWSLKIYDTLDIEIYNL